MPKVVGHEEKLNKRITCYMCTAIIEYKPIEVIKTDRIDESTRIEGIECLECHTFLRTNP